MTICSVLALPGSLGSSMETMSAPPDANAVVIAVPRPPVPPVTIAVLPSKEKSFEISTAADAALAIVIGLFRILGDDTRRVDSNKECVDDEESYLPVLVNVKRTSNHDCTIQWTTLASYRAYLHLRAGFSDNGLF